MFKKELEYVKCDVCKHLMEKCDAQKVEVREGYYGSTPYPIYFCVMHKQPYDRITVLSHENVYEKQWVKVTEEGDVVKLDKCQFFCYTTPTTEY